MAKNRDDQGGSGNPGPSRYDDELLCANWNPVIELLACSGAPHTHQNAPRDVSEDDAAAFLGRVYTFGA